MKNKQLEDLFRQKLGDLNIEPSDQARERFNQRIRGRKNFLVYRRLSIAATILLMVSVGIIVTLPRHEVPVIAERSAIIEGEIEQTLTSPSASIAENNPGNQSRNGKPVVQDRETADDHAPGVSAPANDEGTRLSQDAMLAAADKSMNMNGGGEMNTDSEYRDKGSLNTESIDQGAEEQDERLVAVPVYREEPLEKIDSTGTIRQMGDAIVASDLTTAEGNLPGMPDKNEQDAPDPAENDSVTDGFPEKDLLADAGKAGEKQVAITIEYIPGNRGAGEKAGRMENVKQIYNKVNNLFYPDEVLGDIRALKDQLFALDLKNLSKSETQTQEEE